MFQLKYAIPVCILISTLVLVYSGAEEYEADILPLQQEDPSANRSIRQAANPSANPATGIDLKDSADSSDSKNTNEETLNGLKCDFGTADSPDLCKFKITEPLGGKSLSKWNHGSGKFALYQGGPLMDAGEGNDTTGGYIFYETTSTANHTTPIITHPSLSANLHTYESFGHVYANKRGFSSVNYAEVKPTDQRITDLQQDTQQHPSMNLNLPGSLLISPNLTAPGPSGMCLSFQYIIHGLSADELRVHVNDHKTERTRQIWAVSESDASNWTRGEILYPVTNVHSIVFSTFSSSQTKLEQQQRKFRGYIALDRIEINKQEPTGGESFCKGHCNFDGDLCGWLNAENQAADDFDWSFGRGSENLFTGPTSDFVSSMNNELTGSYLYINSGYPRRPGDKAILVSSIFQPTTVNEAMCMRFAVHMFGSGIGSLTIKIRYTEEVTPASPGNPNNNAGPQPSNDNLSPQPRNEAKTNDVIIWEMFGDAGNNWHQAQTSVSSSKSPFQVLIEGEVGENHLGDVAIDEISFSSGPCPTSPPVASKNYGDCTFEQSMCYWRNPEADVHIDDLDWIRSADEPSIHGPNIDHTIKKRSGAFLKLENTFREPKSGTRAFLLSPIFEPKPSGSVQCLSFYYYMFMRTIGSSGPNLGTIRIYLASNNELSPIWRLTNPISSPIWRHGRVSLYTNMLEGQPVAPTKLFQIAFEGIWGDAQSGAIALDDITVFDGACDIMPPEAKSVPLECSFDVDLCTWMNKTSEIYAQQDAVDQNNSPFLQSVNSVAGSTNARHVTSSAKRISWQLATVESRPVNLQDHTYKAPIGYVYVDVLENSGHQMKFTLQSSEMVIPAAQQTIKCLSFWFAAYGRQETNHLSVHMTQASSSQNEADSGSSKSNQPNASLGTNNQRLSTDTTGSSSNSANSESENSNGWKMADGKQLWIISLRNITESRRRKWQYGQVALKVDSNFIVKFKAISHDGGFALDDLSFYEGFCETRPSAAKVKSDEDEEATSQPLGQPKSGS